MKCFVSGGAGFIGSHLVDRLMDTAEVTVFDNLSSGRDSFVARHIGSSRFKFIRADLLDAKALDRVLPGHDVVFHLAANPEAREGITHTDLDLRIGTIATYNLLDAVRRAGIPRFVFASSGTVYGETGLRAVSEDDGPLLPISLYGASKLACEGLISAYSHIFGLQAWVFRFANVVGGRATHGVIFDFVNKLKFNPGALEILGDGTQEKPYLLVDDCVDGMLFGLRNACNNLNVLNLGIVSSTNVTRIAQMLIEEMGLSGVNLSYTGGERGWPGDVPQVRYDVTRMNSLGWYARHSSDEAVRIAIQRVVREQTQQ